MKSKNKRKIRKILCKIGFHKWHKACFDSGLRIQTYASKECLFCGIRRMGFAEMNHPDFWKVIGKYSNP